MKIRLPNKSLMLTGILIFTGVLQASPKYSAKAALQVKALASKGNLIINACETCTDPLHVVQVDSLKSNEGCVQGISVYGRTILETEMTVKFIGKSPNYRWAGGHGFSDCAELDRLYVETKPNTFKRLDGIVGGKSGKTRSLPADLYQKITTGFPEMNEAQKASVRKLAGKWTEVSHAGGDENPIPRFTITPECESSYRTLELFDGASISGDPFYQNGCFYFRTWEKKKGTETIFRIDMTEKLPDGGVRLLGKTKEGRLITAEYRTDLWGPLLGTSDSSKVQVIRYPVKPTLASGVATWDIPGVHFTGFVTNQFISESARKSMPNMATGNCQDN